MNKSFFSKPLTLAFSFLIVFSVGMTILSVPFKRSAEKSRLRKYEIAKIIVLNLKNDKTNFFEHEAFILREDLSKYQRVLNITKNKKIEEGVFVWEGEVSKYNVKWHCADSKKIIVDSVEKF